MLWLINAEGVLGLVINGLVTAVLIRWWWTRPSLPRG